MRLICHKCTNYFLLRNFFLLFLHYLSLIYPRWRKLAACVQFKIQNSKYKIQNSELFSTEPSAKDERRKVGELAQPSM